MRLRSVRGFALTMLVVGVGMLSAAAPGQRGAAGGEVCAARRGEAV